MPRFGNFKKNESDSKFFVGEKKKSVILPPERWQSGRLRRS